MKVHIKKDVIAVANKQRFNITLELDDAEVEQYYAARGYRGPAAIAKRGAVSHWADPLNQVGELVSIARHSRADQPVPNKVVFHKDEALYSSDYSDLAWKVTDRADGSATMEVIDETKAGFDRVREVSERVTAMLRAILDDSGAEKEEEEGEDMETEGSW